MLVPITDLALPTALSVLGAILVALFAADAFGGAVATIWAASIWAAAPAVMLLRGLALLKLARLARRGSV
jgi:hypothetical protein